MSRPIYCPHFVTTECVTKVLKCMNDEESPAVILYGEVIPFFIICFHLCLYELHYSEVYESSGNRIENVSICTFLQ